LRYAPALLFPALSEGGADGIRTALCVCRSYGYLFGGTPALAVMECAILAAAADILVALRLLFVENTHCFVPSLLKKCALLMRFYYCNFI